MWGHEPSPFAWRDLLPRMPVITSIVSVKPLDSGFKIFFKIIRLTFWHLPCVWTPQLEKHVVFLGSSKTIWPLPFLPIPGSQRLDESGLPNPPCLDGSQLYHRTLQLCLFTNIFVYVFCCFMCFICLYCFLAYIRHFWMWIVEILSVVSNQKDCRFWSPSVLFQGEVKFFQSRTHVLKHLTDMFFSPGQRCQIWSSLVDTGSPLRLMLPFGNGQALLLFFRRDRADQPRGL